MEDRAARRTLRARWLWQGPGRLRENWQVTLADGRVTAVGPHQPGQSTRDLGDGLLLPGLVNAHTHLELSGLRGLVPTDGDFVGWVLRMVALRPNQDQQQAAQATLAAAREMADQGVALVGDITNTGLARQALTQAGLHAVSFFEALGQNNCQPPPPEHAWSDGLLAAQGVAAHAPYSVPGPRIAALKAQAGANPFCVHLAESRAEMEFLADAGPQGQRLAEFLAQRGVERADLALRAPRPLAHLLALGVMDQTTLAVHGVQLTPSEADDLAATGASLCVCPRSNLGLTGQIAPVERLLAAGVNLCLGTDSLASTPDLNLWAEMRTLGSLLPNLPPEAILTMATSGGAKALGLADLFGRLEPGVATPLCFAPLTAATKSKHVLEVVVREADGNPGPVC